MTIIWQGGATSTATIQMNRPGAGHDHALPGGTAELTGRLARHYDDCTVAHILAQQRRATGTGLRWTKPASPASGSGSASPPASQIPAMSAPTARMRPWPPSPKPGGSSASPG